jgi:NAD(P)-dependent dehydrogenase (short-subunit alcohol dehydrogenase family)
VWVQAASLDWGDRGARLNSLSPGIIMTPLAMDELNSHAGEAYQRMIKASASGRVDTPDEIGATAAFLMGRDGSFITGTDLLIDGGVIASIAISSTWGSRRSDPGRTASRAEFGRILAQPCPGRGVALR